MRPRKGVTGSGNRWLQAEEDPAVLEDILAPDFLHVVPGTIITKDQQLQFLREHPAGEQRSDKDFEDLHVRVYVEAGNVNGVVLANTERGERKTLFTMSSPIPMAKCRRLAPRNCL